MSNRQSWVNHQDPLSLVVMGGLGNQLFQFATALHLSSRFKKPLFLDTTWYADFGEQEFWLDRVFDLEKLGVVIAPPSGRPALIPRRWRWRHKLHSPSRRKMINLSPQYDSRVTAIEDVGTLVGYFQSWRYFEDDIEGTLQLFLESLTQFALKGAHALNQHDEQPIALHMRLGDYRTDRNRHRYGDVSFPFVERALEHAIAQRPGADRLDVFSNDASTAAELLTHVDTSKFSVHFVVPQSPPVDMVQLSRYSTMIMANSSFSWWAAALPGTSDKSIYCPSPWSYDPHYEGRDLHLGTWTIVDR